MLAGINHMFFIGCQRFTQVHIVRVAAQAIAVVGNNFDGAFVHLFQYARIGKYHIYAPVGKFPAPDFFLCKYKSKIGIRNANKPAVPVFYQQQINSSTRVGVWKIEETEEFFLGNVPVGREITHPHKRLQHLAGRFLLQYLFPAFPYELIKIADTRKPYLPDEQYHFSISHCGDYAAAIVSRTRRVGVDVEIPGEKVLKIAHKFLSPEEQSLFMQQSVDQQEITRLWSAKEAVFKWYGLGQVDFSEHIRIYKQEENLLHCDFKKTGDKLVVETMLFEGLVLAMVVG